MSVVFTVFGKPQTQGSMKYVGHRNGRPVLTSDNAGLAAFRQEVGWSALRAVQQSGLEAPMAGKHVPVEVSIEFTLLRPESVDRDWPAVKPDLDKLMRAVLDGAAGVLYKDDGQVVLASLKKQYGTEEKVHVSARIIKEKP